MNEPRSLPVLVNPCGDCRLCCRIMAVNDLDPPKPRNQWCEHVEMSVGCRIYEIRPPTCRDFECMWLQAQSHPTGRHEFTPDLNPKKCGVVFVYFDQDGRKGIAVHVDPARPLAWSESNVRKVWEGVARAGLMVVIAIGSRRIVYNNMVREPVEFEGINPEFEV